MESAREIGGYFGLDLPDYGEGAPHPEAMGFQSARAAIHAALASSGFIRVLMPGYICDSIIQSGNEAGLAVETYDLDESLFPRNLPKPLPKGSAVLYVNYFGLCGHHVARLAREMPRATVLVDNSHALFATSHAEALATAYSPRKMVGLPDGGLLVASPRLGLAPPKEEDQGSFERMRFLLRRMACSAREGYGDFQEARASLRDTMPLAMSRLTRRLMRSIRWDEVRTRRRENYAAMAALLDGVNDRPWPMADEDVPLCYPFTVSGCAVAGIRNALAAEDIFTATYWPDARPRAKAGSVEARLIDETLFLPIDQRIDSAQVEWVARRVLQLTGRKR